MQKALVSKWYNLDIIIGHKKSSEELIRYQNMTTLH